MTYSSSSTGEKLDGIGKEGQVVLRPKILLDTPTTQVTCLIDLMIRNVISWELHLMERNEG